MALGDTREMPCFRPGSLGAPLGSCGGCRVVMFWCILGEFLCADNLPFHRKSEELMLRRDVPDGNPHAAADNKRDAF